MFAIRKRQFLDAGYLAYSLPPQGRDIVDLQRPVIDHRQFCPGNSARVTGCEGPDVRNHRIEIGVLRDILRVQIQDGLFDLVKRGITYRRRGARLHFELHPNEIAGHLREQHNSYQAAIDQSHGHDKNGSKSSDGQATIIDRFFQRRPIVIVNQCIKAMLYMPLNLQEESRHALQ